MVSPVIDLSHWNPTPDWARIKEAGVVGVIHKATESTNYVDDTLFKRARAAMNAGLCWSTYHFLRPGSIKKQMDWYLKTVNPRPGERMCLDHEDAGVSLADLKEAVSYLIEDSRGLQVTIYSGHVIKDQLGNTKDTYLAENTSLWLAQYASTPSWPKATWPQWSLWQFTDKATVSGISAPVDGNRFNGSAEQCVKWFGPAGAEPAPEPEPEPEPEPDRPPVLVAITSNGNDIVVTVDGVPLGAD